LVMPILASEAQPASGATTRAGAPQSACSEEGTGVEILDRYFPDRLLALEIIAALSDDESSDCLPWPSDQSGPHRKSRRSRRSWYPRHGT
jgi:hypothetical protein